MIQTLQFSTFEGIQHGISTRLGGVSAQPFATLNMGFSTADEEENIVINRRRFLDSVGVEPGNVVAGRLVHGSDVSIFQAQKPDSWPAGPMNVRSDSERTEEAFKSDAALSSVPGLHLFMTFADCVPLLFADRNRGVVGAAHAGWRGTALGIGPAVVAAMEREFGCHREDIVVGIGPSIGPCCYSVGTEVIDTFARQVGDPVLIRNGWVKLDLWATNENQLLNAGIPASSIENPRICTGCNVDTYFSHRAENGRTGRFALCIGLE